MFTSLLFALLVLVVTRILWKRWKYDLHKIPSPPGLPIIGHTLDIADGGMHFVKWFRKRHKQVGFPKIFKCQVGLDTSVFVVDPVIIRTEINHKIDPIPRHPSMKAFSSLIVCNQDMKDTLMATSDKVYAKQIRKAYSKGQQTVQLKRSFPALKSVVDRMIQIIEKERENRNPIDFQKLCMKFSLDAIGTMTMETCLGGLDGSRGIHEGIVETARIARESSLNPFLKVYCQLFPNSKTAKDMSKIPSDLKMEWDRLTNEILERPDPPEGETPIWYNLKKTVDPDTNERLSYEILRSEIATAVFGGMDTTGHQISWILGMLATQPRVAEKLFHEIKANGLCDPEGGEVEFEDLASLPYLDAVIKEGFRLVHILPISVPRLLQKDRTIFGYRLPKGTLVSFPCNQAVNSEADWGDPEVVRPERWLAGEDMSSKYFETFQTGSRDCPGQKIAKLVIRLTLVKLLSKYQLSTEKSFEYLRENSVDIIVTKCEPGMWLTVSPRNDEKTE